MNRLVVLVIFGDLLYGACGLSEARIVGGTEALPGEVPSIVALLRHVPGSQTYSFHCAGTLIYPDIVISTAQCFDNMFLQPISWRVRVGSVLHNSDGVLLNVTGIRRHEHFDPISLANDVALVILEDPVRAINATPILLPTTNTIPGSGGYGHIAGWGATSATAPPTEISSILHVANVLISNRAICVKNLGLIGFTVLANHICTTGWGAGICHNDIGSPLYHGGQLVGVASYHIGCGFDFYPAVYTAVAPYLPWIQQIILEPRPSHCK